MDQTRTRRRRGGVAHATTPWGPSQAHGRAAGADSGPVGPRSAGLWLSWGRVDGQTHRRGARADVGSPLPSRACQPFAAPGGLERAAPPPAGDPTRRGGHSSVARGALARQQKRAVEEGYTLVWGDESGCSLLPHAERTWAPKGETPVLLVNLTHDHLSASSGSTLDGRLVMQVQESAFDSEGVVAFLRVLLRKIRAKVLVISRWGADPHGTADQGLPRAGSCQAAASGAVAGGRAGFEPG
jgi:hypothetical protein